MKSRFLAVLFGGLLAADAQDPLAAEKERVRSEQDVSETTAGLAKSADNIRLLSRRGDAYLFLGRFRESVADFEKMIALDPALDAPHWRLGIAYYFAGDFAKSAAQFQKYHAYDGGDRENGIWKYLAQAKLGGVEKARGEMLEYTRFDREPFPALYEMFAGKKSGEEVLAHVAEKQLGSDPRVAFFAHYYAGLNEELSGRRESAMNHLQKAVALYTPRGAQEGGPGYMWQVARVHLQVLTAGR